MLRKEGRTAPTRRGERKRAEVLQSLRGVVALLHQSARGVEQSTGLTNAQLFILQQLHESEPRSINDLAAVVMTQQSTVSLVVSRLENVGLVRRTRAEDDARRAQVTLTPAGRRILRAAPMPPIARLLAALDGLAASDRNALHRGLTAFASSLGIADGGEELLFEEGSRATARRRPRRAAG